MPNASSTIASSASQTSGQPIPVSYGYVWATGKRHAYYQLQNTGNKYVDYHRVGIWLLGHGEWDGPSELWINDVLAWKGSTSATPPSGFSGQTWMKAADGGQPLVFNFHSGCDATIGSGLSPVSNGPDQGVDVLWGQFPPAVNRLHFNRIAYYSIMRKQSVPNPTNDHQNDPSQWTDIAPVGLWRGLKCRLFDDSGAMTGYAFTTNPVWHAIDLLLRRKLFPEYNLDLTLGPDDLPSSVRGRFNWGDIYDAAQYCDETLTNGRRRFQGSYSFSSQTTLQACLEQILLVCRGFMGEHAGQISINCDMPRSSVFTISGDHIEPGSFEANDQAAHTAPNRYIAQFRDVLVPEAAKIASIATSPGGRPHVVTEGPHPFNAGDYVSIGGTSSVYDREWKVYSVPPIVGAGTPSQIDPTSLDLETQGSNFPASIGAGGSIGLLYSRFKERAPEFWHKSNMLARGMVGLGITRQRNRVRDQIDLATTTFDQASRIANYEKGRRLGPDVSPYVTPALIRLSLSMFARDTAGNLAAAIRPGDRITLDDSVNATYAGDYEVLDGMKIRPPAADIPGSGSLLQRAIAGRSGTIDLVLGRYSEDYMIDESDPDSAGWNSVPDSDPGNDTTFTPIDLEGGGSCVFFTGIQQSGTQFQLPSTGYPAANLFDWATPAGANIKYHSMRVIEKCDADANRNLTLTYTDDIGNFWSGDVAFAALTWLSSDVPTSSGGMQWLELTLLGGEKILFGAGVFADGASLPALPSGYSTAQCFRVAYAHDTPTTATHNPRIYGANVDSSGVVHFKYTDYAGNFWSGNAKVLVFAWKNNMGTVTTETDSGMTWMKCTLSNGKKFGVGCAYGIADGGSVGFPAEVGDQSTLESIVGSSSYANNGGSYHTFGVIESYLDSSAIVRMRFGNDSATYPGWGDVFALFCTAGVALATVVAISPSSATVPTGTQQQFTATVANNANHSVTWSVDGIAGGNSTVGTIDASGLYSAPITAGSHTITATSVADPTAVANVAVTVSGSGTDAGGFIVTED